MSDYEEVRSATHQRTAEQQEKIEPLPPRILTCILFLTMVSVAVLLDIYMVRFGLYLRYPPFEGSGIPANVLNGLSYSLAAALLLGHLILRAASKRWSDRFNRMLERIGVAALALISLGAAFFMSSSLQMASEVEQLFTSAPTFSLWAILAGLFVVTLLAVTAALKIVERNVTKIIEVRAAKAEQASLRSQLREVSEAKVVLEGLNAEKVRQENSLIERAASEAGTQAAFCEVRLSEIIEVREAAEEARRLGHDVEIDLPEAVKFTPLETLRTRLADLRRATPAALADQMRRAI